MLRNNSPTAKSWESESGHVPGSIMQSSVPDRSLNSSRWAPTNSTKKPGPSLTTPKDNVTTMRFSAFNNQGAVDDSDMEMENGISPNFGYDIVANAERPHPGDTPAPLVGGMYGRIETYSSKPQYPNPRSAILQLRPVSHNHLLEAPINFDSEIEMDDDGDVVMIDLSDPNTIMIVDKVARGEREACNMGEHIDLKPMVSSSRINNPSCVLVIDTSFILSHLQLVNSLVMSHNRWRNVIVMPWATIQELDGLKKSNRENDGVVVGKLARSAINWAFGSLGRRDPGVWVQVKEEKYDSSATHGDPAILDCCVYFQARGHMAVLLSHDKNLCLQAMSYGIGFVGTDAMKKSAEEILSQLIKRPQNPHILPFPSGESVSRPPSERVAPAYPISHMSLPSRRGISPMPHHTYSTYGLDRQKIQPPFYPSASADISYLPYGTRSTKKILPGTSNGLQDSIYATGKNSNPQPHRPAIPSFGRPESFFSRDQDIKLGLKGLLQKVSRELVSNLTPLIRKRSIAKLRDVETLQRLSINPEIQIQSIDGMETFFHMHWATIFFGVFPENFQLVFDRRELSQRYTQWSQWAESSGLGAARPKPTEVKKWIDDWDLIWKRLICTEKESSMNVDTVDGWKAVLVMVGLALSN